MLGYATVLVTFEYQTIVGAEIINTDFMDLSVGVVFSEKFIYNNSRGYICFLDEIFMIIKNITIIDI